MQWRGIVFDVIVALRRICFVERRIKQMNGEPEIKWRVVRKAKAYTPESKRCLLCLAEKFEIANYPGDNLLNQRSEIVAKCRHRRKHLITFYKANAT